MSKDPAFLFYTSDFLTGTMFMDFEQKGAYITIMCLQKEHKHLTEEEICKIMPVKLWESIKNKFQKDNANKYYNKRLEIEIKKRNDYTDSRRKNRNNSKLTIESYVPRMEDVNINVNINVIKKNIEEFIAFRMEIKKPFKSQLSFNKWIKKLIDLSGDNKDAMIVMLDNSIANGWQGIFSLKANKPSNTVLKGDFNDVPGKYDHLKPKN